MLSIKDDGGNDDPTVLKVVTLSVVGRITDSTPEKLIVFVGEVMLRANDVVALPWEVGKLLFVDGFNVCAKLSVPDAADIL